MARESVHKKLERVRPPRVHVTYDVEIGDAIEIKEIPFVMGVLGDFSGMPEDPLPSLKERRFVDITPDNFDSVLASMSPRVAFSVENKLCDDPNAGKLGVDLTFKSMEDFEPEQVARQVKPLRELLDCARASPTFAAPCRATRSWSACCRMWWANSDKMNRSAGETKAGKPIEGGSNGND